MHWQTEQRGVASWREKRSTASPATCQHRDASKILLAWGITIAIVSWTCVHERERNKQIIYNNHN